MTSTMLETNSLLPISIGKSGYPVYELMEPSAPNGYRRSTRIGLMPTSSRGRDFLKERTSEGDLSASREMFEELLNSGHIVANEYPELLMALPNSKEEVFVQRCPLYYFYDKSPVNEYVLMSVLSGSILTFWGMPAIYEAAREASYDFKPDGVVPCSSAYAKDKARMAQLRMIKRQLCESVSSKKWKNGSDYFQIDINTLCVDLADNIRAVMTQVAEFDAKNSSFLSAVANQLDLVSDVYNLTYSSCGTTLTSTTPHFWFKASLHDDETVAFTWESGNMQVRSENLATFVAILKVLLSASLPSQA